MGDSLLRQGRAREALAVYQEAIDAEDDAVAAHVGEARAFLALGQREDACDSLEVALALDPAAAEALRLLARLYADAEDWTCAAELLQRAAEAVPGDTELSLELGLALNRAGRPEEAIATYREAIARDPSSPGPRVNLGLIHLQQLGEPERAERLFREALATCPDYLPALANLGLALEDQGRYEEAFDLYERVLESHPDATELRWNRALAHLAAGNFGPGWDDYELRLVRRGGRDLRRFPFPTWQGDRIAGDLLVLAEQGLGDEIMFASCLPELGRYADQVIVECSPVLGRLFERSFPGIRVHPMARDAKMDWARTYPGIAAKCAIGSLPRWLRRTRECWPQRTAYLATDAQLVARYRERLRAFGPGCNVGLSWRAGPRAVRSAIRSIALTELLPALQVPGVRYFNLQYGLNAAEREAMRQGGIHVVDDGASDLDEVAALMAALDLVLTVGNTNAHVAGAIGAEALVLLPASADWRWTRNEERSLWYPTLTLLRDREGKRWSHALTELSRRLHAYAASRHGVDHDAPAR